jgi:hypothetical protein
MQVRRVMLTALPWLPPAFRRERSATSRRVLVWAGASCGSDAFTKLQIVHEGVVQQRDKKVNTKKEVGSSPQYLVLTARNRYYGAQWVYICAFCHGAVTEMSRNRHGIVKIPKACQRSILTVPAGVEDLNTVEDSI